MRIAIGADIRRFFIYVIKGEKQPDFDQSLQPQTPEAAPSGEPAPA